MSPLIDQCAVQPPADVACRMQQQARSGMPHLLAMLRAASGRMQHCIVHLH